jgi:putative SOS response-associated peptidase YedK
MASIHHRMPVILQPETADRWLAGEDGVIEYVASHGPQLRAWPVDRRVNNARNEGEELIEPAGEVLES